MFYDNFVSLCEDRGVSPSKVLDALGMSRGSLFRWKNGGEPRNEYKKKIADYFGIAVPELMSGKIEKAPAPEKGEREVLIDEIMNYVEKLSPEYQKIALAQLKALSQTEEK